MPDTNIDISRWLANELPFEETRLGVVTTLRASDFIHDDSLYSLAQELEEADDPETFMEILTQLMVWAEDEGVEVLA